jgi:glucosylceramidase
MSRARQSINGVCLALLLSACSCGSNTSQGPGGTSDEGGNTGNPNGGNTGNPNGGNTGNPNGGDTGNPNGGNNGDGGSAGNPSGGTSGPASGGNTGSGGAAGKASGGTTTNPSAGAGGRSSGGAIGGGGATSAAGGSTSARGGAVSNGGSQAGGAQGQGGASGDGGATTASNVLVTSASGSYWKTATWTDSSGTATVTVNDSSAAQTWEGFGGAFNEMGWNFLSTKALQDEAIQLLFGKEGCNFAWGRIPMGASDYAIDRYTDDEVPAGSTDTEMAKFSIDRDKQKLIPYIKAALAVKPSIRFWASPWTPPTWMKSSPYQSPGNPVNAFDGGTMKSDSAVLTAHAQYFVKYVQAFGEQGIKIEYVAPQNEPNYSQNYPSCIWSASTFTSFIAKYLGPALKAANSTAQVMLGTMSNNGANADVAVAQAVLADPSAKGYCKVVGVQWGMSDANQISNLKNKGASGMNFWLSEHKCGGPMGQDVPKAPNDFAYGKDSWTYIRDAIKNGVTAYNTWNMVLDAGGRGIDNTRIWAQNALLVVEGGKITQTPAYYVFRHFSQFVEPGANVVATSGGDAIAFKNPDGSLVAVMYSASANSSYVISIGGKKLQFSMPAGWATVKYKP